MPTYRPLFFFPPTSRLGIALPIDDKNGGRGGTPFGRLSKTGLDALLRYSHSFSSIDLGFYAFHGISRVPAIDATFDPQLLMPVLLTRYDKIVQLGLDAQATYAGFIQKLEATYRFDEAQNFMQTGLGAEYTFAALFGSSWDLGVFAEHYYSNVDFLSLIHI